MVTRISLSWFVFAYNEQLGPQSKEGIEIYRLTSGISSNLASLLGLYHEIKSQLGTLSLLSVFSILLCVACLSCTTSFMSTITLRAQCNI